MRRSITVALLALAGVMALGGGSAGAAPTDPFQYQYSFTPGIPGGIENPSSMVVNHATGNILVLEPGKRQIDQFDPEGHPVDFSALGSPSISLIAPPVAFEPTVMIDNTGGPTQGNFYVYEPFIENGGGGEYFWSYAADGSAIGSTPLDLINTSTLGFNPQAVGVLPDGTLQIVGQGWSRNTDQTVQPLGPREPFSGPVSPRSSMFDELGNFYVKSNEDLFGRNVSNQYASLNKTGLPGGGPIAFDPSTNDVYTRVDGTEILGVHYSDPLIPSTPFVAFSRLRNGGTFAFDATGQTAYVAEGNEISVFHREPTLPPALSPAMTISEIGASTVEFFNQASARGAAISYHFEYGTDTSYGNSTPEKGVPLGYFPVKLGASVGGLAPDTTYHVRVVATNSAGTTYGPDKVFRTYPTSGGGANDACANALSRKQTGAKALPDCRSYELVSAPDTGGYDVESYLAPDQSPFGGFPFAKDRVLYSTHAGAIPGPWNATNKGPDPYLASRTANGWSTQYEGLPADINPAAGSFSSVLGEADSSLDTLAFAGANLCGPCFDSGLETGIPLRMPNGNLAQGMSGSLAGSVPATAKPEGKVAKYFSKDGKHLLFASKYAFEPGANDNGSDLTVYERDLASGGTEIVSTDESGNALTGEGISELDVSSDGSRVIIGKKVSADSQGNEYLHPYLHIAGKAGSVDLAPGTTSGVLYAGMSEDGSKVFFTSTDKLEGTDTDDSADLYEADVDGSGNLELKALTDNNSDACDPVASTDGEHWNTTGSSANCDAVAISGGGGVASSNGAVYFLSPESFGGEGALNQPNLYLATPGDSPAFVATLEPDNPLVLDSVKASATRKTGDFQTTPDGDFAAFASALELTGQNTFDLRAVFRYDATSNEFACTSCDKSGGTDDTLADNVELAPNGLSLLSDGRLFFTTRFPLVLADTNKRKDVYEWSDGERQLISSGSGPFDSGLLSASADGTDVFFFTHDALAPDEDRSGSLMKIYDAREGGGFFRLPPSVPCQASDECHGPGTVTPPAPDIRSAGKTTQGNVVVCAKNRVKRRGQCVKPKKARKKHSKHKKHASKRAAKTSGKRGGRDA